MSSEYLSDYLKRIMHKYSRKSRGSIGLIFEVLILMKGLTGESSDPAKASQLFGADTYI